MAIKNKQEKIEDVTPNTVVADLGLETEYSTGNGSTWNIDVTGLDKISIDDLNIGDTVDGMPEFVLFDNSDRTNADGSKRKWDNICLHLADIEGVDEYGEQTGEYVVAYLPCPRPDKNGVITNVFANGFYHGTFSLIYSYLRTIDESNVLDSNGNIINTIKRINIVKLLEKLNEYEHMEIKVIAGANNDINYLNFMITEMK